jgi:hypothetical protein
MNKSKRKIDEQKTAKPPKHGIHENKNDKSINTIASTPVDIEEPLTNDTDIHERLPWDDEDEGNVIDDEGEE